jgi:hypothetical protein
MTRHTTAACRGCRHFAAAATALEAAFPGLASLSSAYASVRADDGLCLAHDRYVTAASACAQFSRPAAD